MNNKKPNKYLNKKVNQIKEPSNGFGINCLFKSRIAKLHFANNRIALIFIIILIGNQIVILEIHL